MQDEIAQREALLGGGQVAPKDSVNGHKFIRDIYEMVGSTEKSVPVLFDKYTNQVVNNESAEIVRMMALGFVDLHRADAPQLYPEHLTKQVDALNSWIYPEINNGAYKAGFSSDQATCELHSFV
jgi:putative glutathione S-transferase